jgi:LacI family transcriptional regulator
MEKKNHTIKDIARLAGLSRGTVDKVIHNRSGVSQENIDKVNKIIKEVKYQPNLLARSLKKHKPFSIAVIIPEYEDDAYWIKCHSGILKAEKEFKEYGGRIQSDTNGKMKHWEKKDIKSILTIFIFLKIALIQNYLLI